MRALLRRLFPSIPVMAADHLQLSASLGETLDQLTTLDVKIAHAASGSARDELTEKRAQLEKRLEETDPKIEAVTQQLRLVNEELYFSNVEMDGAILAQASDSTIANITNRISSLEKLKASIIERFEQTRLI